MPANTINVDFTAEAGTQVSATIERGLSATGPWVFLTTVDLLGEQAFVTDNTAPLDTAVWYRATADDDTVEVYGPFTLVSGGNVFLRDPLRPWADLEFTFCATQAGLKREMCLPSGPEFVWVGFGQEVYRADAGLFDRLDAETPADVYARRKRLDGSLSFMTKTLAAAQRVYELFTAGGPLFLQLPTVYGWQDAYIQPGDLTKDYLYPDQRMPHRIWTVPFTIVDATTGPTQGTECANWCTVEATWPTFADMTAAGGTWADIASGETQCPDGEPVPAVVDTFSRVVVDGWGTADTGQTWTTSGGAPANYDVNGTKGLHTHDVIGTSMNSLLIPSPGADVTVRVDFSVDSVPLGNAYLAFVLARAVDGDNAYVARLRIAPTTGDLVLTLRKRIAAVETQLSTFSLGAAYVANAVYTIRLRVEGTNLMAKAWLTSTPEPAGWQTTAVDADLVAAANLGVRSTPFAGVTNPPPITFTFDNFVAGA